MQTEQLCRVLVIFLLVSLILPCCKNVDTGDKNALPDLDHDTIILTALYLKENKIKTGIVEKKPVFAAVECLGTIELRPDASTVVSAPIGGFVKKHYFLPGRYINKGDTIAMLEHMDYINPQQDFLIAKNQYEYFRETFKRQGELTVENASSIKKMQQAQADFRVTEVKLESLKKQLSLMGINPDSLSVDNMQTAIFITSPVHGYISKISSITGKYASSEDIICEIINPDRLQLHLHIPAKDILKIKPEQEIIFRPLSDLSQKHHTTIKSLVRSLNIETNTYSVYSIVKPHNEFYPGAEVKADILLYKDTVTAVPAEAIFTRNNKKFIFSAFDSVYKSIAIETGIGNSEFKEIINLPDNMVGANIIISNIDFLLKP
ncbi:MAG: efflux RND transporter periplasmic adaptor subunit [Bacteroidales bacterium]